LRSWDGLFDFVSSIFFSQRSLLDFGGYVRSLLPLSSSSSSSSKKKKMVAKSLCKWLIIVKVIQNVSKLCC